jgi:hypothetical protein
MRVKTMQQMDGSCLSRLDQRAGRVMFLNTPWHPDDAMARCEALGWAMLTMDAEGYIRIQDDLVKQRRYVDLGEHWEPWDSEQLRPAYPNDSSDVRCRLTAHDPDPENQETLWPERLSRADLERERATRLPEFYNQNYLCMARDDDAMLCKREYVDRCLRLAREEGIHGSALAHSGTELSFTGVDLAFGEKDKHDKTAFVTFYVRADGARVILDVEEGRWPAPVILEKCFEKARRFNSCVTVENNAAQQMLSKFMLEKDKSFPVYGYTTGAHSKAHPEMGLPAIFGEMMNGAWRIPNDAHGQKTRDVTSLCEGMVNYTPSTHTHDLLMAMLFAWDRAKKWGALARAPKPGEGTNSPGAAVMDR